MVLVTTALGSIIHLPKSIPNHSSDSSNTGRPAFQVLHWEISVALCSQLCRDISSPDPLILGAAPGNAIAAKPLEDSRLHLSFLFLPCLQAR